MPAQAIADMQKDGAGFAGFATWLDMTPAHPDLFAMPDAAVGGPAALAARKWPGSPPTASWTDKPVAQAPRIVLKTADRRGRRQGLRVKTGVEAEFFLIDARRRQRSPTEYDNAAKPCYDQQALMRRYDVIAEICDYMLELGWGPYQNDHEDANGQFEMNWAFDDALVTADRHSFFKFMVQVGRREARPARHLHAEALPESHRLGLPRSHFGVGQGRQDQHVFAATTTRWACRRRATISSAAS